MGLHCKVYKKSLMKITTVFLCTIYYKRQICTKANNRTRVSQTILCNHWPLKTGKKNQDEQHSTTAMRISHCVLQTAIVHIYNIFTTVRYATDRIICFLNRLFTAFQSSLEPQQLPRMVPTRELGAAVKVVLELAGVVTVSIPRE